MLLAGHAANGLQHRVAQPADIGTPHIIGKPRINGREMTQHLLLCVAR